MCHKFPDECYIIYCRTNWKSCWFRRDEKKKQTDKQEVMKSKTLLSFKGHHQGGKENLQNGVKYLQT